MLLPQLTRNDRGFGMVMVMVLVALASGVAVYVMNSGTVLTKMDNREMSSFDKEELETEMRMILQHNCTLSLAGETPGAVTFQKKQINDPAKGPGLPVEFWMGTGNKRDAVRFKENGRVHDIVLTSLRLFMNKGTATNFPEGYSKELGTIRVKYTSQGRGVSSFDLPVTIGVHTNTTGLSKLISCSSVAQEDACDAIGLLYNQNTGQCQFEDACEEWNELAEASEGEGSSWSGTVKASCTDNVNSRIRDIQFSQYETSVTEGNNGLSVRCCFPRTLMSVRCVDLVTRAPLEIWTGTREAFCNEKVGGYLQALQLSQVQLDMGTEVNGLKIRCCYPYY